MRSINLPSLVAQQNGKMPLKLGLVENLRSVKMLPARGLKVTSAFQSPRVILSFGVILSS